MAQAPRFQPRVSINLGFGNYYGWVGTAGEVYLLPGHVSVFAGMGLLPRDLFDIPTTMAGAAGLRYYAPFGRSRHRVFMDLSMSLLEVRQAVMIGAAADLGYGPGLSLGYSYLARSGFTFTAGAGAGRAFNDFMPILHIGLGCTWSH